MSFSAILLVFENSHVFVLQVCKLTDLQVHISIDCPYFYGLSVKISDLLHLVKSQNHNPFPYIHRVGSNNLPMSWTSCGSGGDLLFHTLLSEPRDKF